MADNIATQSDVHKYDVWILWIAANTVGTVIGTITFYILALFLGFFGSPALPGQQSELEIVQDILIGDFQAYIPFGALMGLMQWLVLRRHIARSGAWFLTSAVAMYIGSAASDLLQIFIPSSSISIGLFVQWFLFGSVSGLLQWIILQKQVHSSSLWVVATIVAGSLAGIFSQANVGFIGCCFGWAFSGIITGGAMFYLLQKRKSSIA